LHIPTREKPYYLDGPLVMKSGQKVTADSKADLPMEQAVKAIEQKLNPDYPKTTPRGDTGKGIWIR
jgi:hypothetical protein